MDEYTVYDSQACLIDTCIAECRLDACTHVAKTYHLYLLSLLALETPRVIDFERLKSALLSTRQAQMKNTLDYLVIVREHTGSSHPYHIEISRDGLPPHYQRAFRTPIHLIDELYDDFFQHPPFEWISIQ